MPIQRPDWGAGGESRAVVPAEPAAEVDAPIRSPAELLAEMGGPMPGTSNGTGISSELRASWEREGGFERNLSVAISAAENILSRVADPIGFEAHFETLPASIKNKAYDFLRIDRARGGAKPALKAFNSALTPQEKAVWKDWAERLSEEEEAAVIAALNKERVR